MRTRADLAVTMPVVHALGFSWWKRRVIPAFLPEYRVHFVRSAACVPSDGCLLLWGSAAVPTGFFGRVLRLEDGFLRSVGLGADLTRPVSWVLDDCGIYYDARQASSLEKLLAQTVFDASMLARAAALRQRIVNCGLTKYNVGCGGWARPVTTKPVVLVIGQVESDASLAFGAPGLRTNLALLQAVRAARPDAHVLYKPHPDVTAGLRAQGAGEAEAQAFCDELVGEVAISKVLAGVDEVHVLTSLAGFEALLRGKAVVCHGHPFYAGWGVTEDLLPVARRNRRLHLDELVAAALILYPRYLSRRARVLIPVEQALDELLAWREQEVQAAWFRKVWLEVKRWVLRRVVGVR